MIAFVVAAGVSIGYYQFVYIPEANAKPILPDDVLNPASSVSVKISPDSAVQSNPDNFVPKSIRGRMGLDNKVIWENKDTVPHTVTSDDDYVDQINGPFDTQKQTKIVESGFVMPGTTFEFVFTKVGEYNYHCVPHPWMKGKVEIVENFA